MISQRDIELIDKFLLFKLNKEESDEFDLRLNDEEFADELSLMKEINSQISNTSRLEIIEKLHDVFAAEVQKENKIISFVQLMKFPIAACLIIGISVSSILIVQSHSYKDVYYSHAGGAAFIKSQIPLK